MTIQPIGSNLQIEFSKHVKGNNLITNKIYGFVEINGGIAEISRGNFMDIELWGVTVIKYERKNNDLSKCVNSLKEVEDYIKELNYEDHSALENLLKVNYEKFSLKK